MTIRLSVIAEAARKANDVNGGPAGLMVVKPEYVLAMVEAVKALEALTTVDHDRYGPCSTVNDFAGEPLKNPRLCRRCKALASFDLSGMEP